MIERLHSFAFVTGAILLPEGEIEPEPTFVPGAATAFPTADWPRSGVAAWFGKVPPEAAVAAPEMPVRNAQELPRRAARGEARVVPGSCGRDPDPACDAAEVGSASGGSRRPR